MRAGGLLAGSGIVLKDAVRRVASMSGFTLGDAVRMASMNPCRFLRGRSGMLDVGGFADLLLFRWSTGGDELHLEEVLVRGRSMMQSRVSSVPC